ncbi:MAG: hypothetical protein IT462_15200 [Planctomycetes bacterium]|nr:hypothetical protein [Planctomycetota bacterium]
MGVTTISECNRSPTRKRVLLLTAFLLSSLMAAMSCTGCQSKPSDGGTVVNAKHRMTAWTKEGRAWTVKTVVTTNGATPSVNFIRYEILKVTDTECVYKMVTMDKDKKEQWLSTDRKFSFLSTKAAEEALAAAKPITANIAVEAGQFVCRKFESETNGVKTTSWMSSEFGGLIVKAISKTDKSETVAELIHWTANDGDPGATPTTESTVVQKTPEEKTEADLISIAADLEGKSKKAADLRSQFFAELDGYRQKINARMTELSLPTVAEANNDLRCRTWLAAIRDLFGSTNALTSHIQSLDDNAFLAREKAADVRRRYLQLGVGVPRETLAELQVLIDDSKKQLESKLDELDKTKSVNDEQLTQWLKVGTLPK